MRMFTLIFILLVSTSLNSQHFDDSDLVGYWKKVNYVDSSCNVIIYLSWTEGFYFQPDKVTFLDDIYSSTLMYGYLGMKRVKHEGINTTSYLINDSLIKIKRVNNDEWVELKIKKLDHDTLILKNEELNYEEWFAKRKYNNIPDIKITKIIYETGYCLGSCPVFKIQIDSNKLVIYEGIDNIELKGKYEFELDKESFDLICNYLEMADLENCKSSYSKAITDAATDKTTVYYDNSKQKYIEDYGEAAPLELIWFYNEMFNIVARLHSKYIK